MPVSVLTDPERRTVAQLSIPRNARDLLGVIHADPHHPGVGASELEDTLRALAGDGLLVNIGSRFETPGHIAAEVDEHAHARSMPDEKARLYEQRLQAPHRAWRAEGDLWVMTQAGFDKLHEPPGGEPAALPGHLVQALMHQEAKRLYQGDPEKIPGNPKASLADRLLEDEFTAWCEQVIRAHEDRTGEKLRPPILGAAGYFDATELLILDPENGKGSAYQETAPWFMALLTVAATDADTGSTLAEASYTGYARKSVAAGDMNSAAAGSASNANPITYAGCTGGSSTVIGFAKCVASTGGRGIKYGTCPTVTISATQTPAQLAAAAFTTTLD